MVYFSTNIFLKNWLWLLKTPKLISFLKTLYTVAHTVGIQYENHEIIVRMWFILDISSGNVIDESLPNISQWRLNRNKKSNVFENLSIPTLWATVYFLALYNYAYVSSKSFGSSEKFLASSYYAKRCKWAAAGCRCWWNTGSVFTSLLSGFWKHPD